MLRCTLSEKELVEAARGSAELTRGIGALEEDKSRTNKNFGALIAEKEASRSLLNDAITSGYVCREVDCEAELSTPKPGYKRVVRLDTGEEVGIEAMTPDEMQRQLDLDAFKFDEDGVCLNPGRVVLVAPVPAVLLVAIHPVSALWFGGLEVEEIEQDSDWACQLGNSGRPTVTEAAGVAFELMRLHFDKRRTAGDKVAAKMVKWLDARQGRICGEAVAQLGAGKEVVVE